jgi:hypothetical protein
MVVHDNVWRGGLEKVVPKPGETTVVVDADVARSEYLDDCFVADAARDFEYRLLEQGIGPGRWLREYYRWSPTWCHQEMVNMQPNLGWQIFQRCSLPHRLLVLDDIFLVKHAARDRCIETLYTR